MSHDTLTSKARRRLTDRHAEKTVSWLSWSYPTSRGGVRIRTAIRAYPGPYPRDYKASNPSRSSMLRRFFSAQ
jgi:hypothetical protein